MIDGKQNLLVLPKRKKDMLQLTTNCSLDYEREKQWMAN